MSDPKAAAAEAAIRRWSMPSVEGPIIGRRVTETEQRATEQANTQKGYAEGIAKGQAEIKAKVAQLDQRIARLDAILQALSRPFEELDDEVEEQLTLLALTVGKQMVRRELKTDPSQVIAVIRESIGRLPAAARDVRVHLHPEDAAVVRELLSAPSNGDRAWTIIEDPAQSRGGCIVRTETSQIDARLDGRMNAIVSAAFGDQRSPVRSDAPGEPSA